MYASTVPRREVRERGGTERKKVGKFLCDVKKSVEGACDSIIVAEKF
jgi:hypothetical protein